MSKAKRQRVAATAPTTVSSTARTVAWWKWGAALAALLVAFAVYGPALNGAFVFDDRYMPFLQPALADLPLSLWVSGVRPLLMVSFWTDYQIGKTDPSSYHATNVIFHFVTSLLVVFIVARLLELTGVAGRMRALLAVAAGAVFLLHPLQTETVAYVTSRSDAMSVMFYYAAFAVFLYCRTERMSLWRAIAVAVLFACAAGIKEHTLTLPVLLVATDYWFRLGGIRKHWILYALLLVCGILGGLWVLRVLGGADTAGFHVAGLTPTMYFFTECRVVWTYVRMFVLPFGQNVDPDVPLSASLFDHGAILGLLAWIAVAVAAWVYRKRFPLAAFGVLVFFLLIAPTSSIVPIRDVQAERRVYLPMLGLLLVCVEFARRAKFRQLAWGGAAVASVLAVLAYQRNEVWAGPLPLWTDAAAKSPNKMRPHFQLAFAHQFEERRYDEAAREYEIAARIGPVDDLLLVDWALALDAMGREDEAAVRLRQAAALAPSAHIYTQLGMVFAKHRRYQEALDALATAERLDPGFVITYVYRGKLYEQSGDAAAAAREYQRALAIEPGNAEAIEGLRRVSR
jgi:hypothetical protein